MEEPLPEGDFAEVLQNGVVLCKLINKLAPGSVKKFKEKVKIIVRKPNHFDLLKEVFSQEMLCYFIFFLLSLSLLQLNSLSQVFLSPCGRSYGETGTPLLPHP